LRLELGDVRERILTDWTPAWETPRPADLAALTAAWNELRAVARVSAWSSVIVQIGRILEGSLAAALNLDTARPGAPRNLNRMLLEAQSRVLSRDDLPSAASRVAGDDIRRLRNLSAHYGELATSELAATQALAILVVFVEALHPKPIEPSGEWTTIAKTAPDELFVERWRELHPNVLARWVLAAPDPPVARILDSHADEFLLALARSTSSRGLTRLPARIAKFADHRTTFGKHLHDNLVHVLTHLSHGSSSNWRRFVLNVPTLGLRPHAQVLAALMPYDGQWLIESMRGGRSPYLLARVITKMKTADHQQWNLLGGTDEERRRIAEAAWDMWPDMHSYSFAANRFVLARSVRSALGAEIVRRAPRAAVLTYLEQVLDIPAVVRIGRFALGDPELGAEDRDRVRSSITERVRAAELRAVRWLPLVIHRVAMTNSALGQEILRTCVAKPAAGLEQRRLLCGVLALTWLVSRRSHATVVERARALARQAGPDWATLVCAGILDICDEPPPGMVRKDLDAALVELVVPADATRDELGLALIGLPQLNPFAVPLLSRMFAAFCAAETKRDIGLPQHAELDRRFAELARAMADPIPSTVDPAAEAG
jgi:hypothetical protein